MKATTATPLLILLSHLAVFPAMASDIKNLVSDETLASYCSTVPLDSETTATLPGLAGTDVTGSVHCESEDLVAGSDDQLDDSDATDDGTDDQGSSDDDSGDDDNGGDSDDGDGSSDDDSSESSGDDDSGDDSDDDN